MLPQPPHFGHGFTLLLPVKVTFPPAPPMTPWAPQIVPQSSQIAGTIATRQTIGPQPEAESPIQRREGEMGSASARRRHHAGDGVAHEARLLVALDLEGEAGHYLPPAAALLVDRDDLGAAADASVHRDGCGKADLVPSVVDAQGEAGGGDQLLSEAVDQGEGEVAVGDRGA